MKLERNRKELIIMTAKMEYADYLTRLARNSTKTEQEFNQENIVREVGKSYGLSEKEIDEVAMQSNI